MRSFDSPQVYTGSPEDYAVLAVVLLAALLAPLFVVLRNRHPGNVHSPPLAWLRAALYFSVIIVISWLSGVFKALFNQPWASTENLGDPIWLGLTALWLATVLWGYVYWWPRGTLTHGRKLHLLPQVIFGLAWGFCSGQLTLALWAFFEEFDFTRIVTAILVFVALSGYGPIYQSGWWDIHVSPPHNIRATNAGKVLFAHMPFLILGLTHFTLFGNVQVFVGFHAVALACSAVAMRFPPFWAPDGPEVSRETALGVMAPER